jgi:hypothetical protein
MARRRFKVDRYTEIELLAEHNGVIGSNMPKKGIEMPEMGNWVSVRSSRPTRRCAASSPVS